LSADQRAHFAQCVCWLYLVALLLRKLSIGIRDCQDAAVERDLLSGELPVISLAVDPFMSGGGSWCQLL